MLHTLLDPIVLLTTFGYLGLIVIILIESGLPIGFFFPGDSLLISAGILASQAHMNIFLIILFCIVAAIIGYGFGYYFGKKVGVRLFDKPDSSIFSRSRLHKAHIFFEKYGAQSIIFARFIPVARTFAPIIAGTSEMSYKKFTVYNVIGGILWGTIVPLLGLLVGRTIPHIDEYLLPIIIVIILTSLIPTAWHLVKQRIKRS
ncbi:MAG: rane protein [Candidatus Saccharibacteria bacterium]|nr:rane protein [Candidatus Saccharibacteria bacterium]